MSHPSLKRTLLVVIPVLLALVSSELLVATVSPQPLSPSTPTPESASSLPASPAMIAWTPTPIEAVVSPGETITVLVSFVSSKNIRRASVQVSPELAALVHADPVSFERIRKGEQKTLTLIVAPSASSTLGTIAGSIQLQRGKVENGDTEADDEDRRDAGKLLPQALSVKVDVALSAKDLLKTKLDKLLSPLSVVVEDDVSAQDKLPSEEILLRWVTPGSSTTTRDVPAPQLNSFTILERRRYDSPIPTLRSVELASDKLLVVAVDTQSRLKGWTIISDPRILRTETPGPDGVLKGQIFFQADPEFSVSVPDEPAVTEVRLYLPHWNGQDFTLALLGTVVLR